MASFLRRLHAAIGLSVQDSLPSAQEVCELVEPQMRQVEEDQYVACHFPLQPAAEVPVTL